jgi:hypothetical protein
MKHLTYADQSVLIGDEAADTLVRFSALLAEKGHADAISLNVLSEDGDTTEASFVIGSGTNLMTTSTNSTIPEPDNHKGIGVMRDKIERLLAPRTAQASDEPWPAAEEFDNHLG